jgi:hypothetical protein
MQRLFAILLFAYFTLGTLLLPMGDFSVLPDLPRMFAHCRETEDPDLDIADFVEEHLLQLDDLMGEAPEPGDKPHQPVQFHHVNVPITIAAPQVLAAVELPILTEPQQPFVVDEVYLADYPASVFRPPIV